MKATCIPKLLSVTALLAAASIVSATDSTIFRLGRQKKTRRLRRHNARRVTTSAAVSKIFHSDATMCARQCRRQGLASRKLRQRCINKCKIRRCNRRIGQSRSRQIVGQSVEMVRFYVQLTPDDDMSKDDYFTIILREDWAPKGYARFKELVDSCFFDDSPFFRVVEDFVAQFGISADKKLNRKFMNNDIEDDPTLPYARNEMGTLSFATSGVDSRSTQIFLNISNNYFLDSKGFTPFAVVQDGWGVVQRLYSKYGEEGPSQGTLSERGSKVAYKSHPMLSRIIRVEYI